MKRRYFIPVDREANGKLHALQFDLSSLTPKQAEVYRLYYGEGKTMREIGKEMGISAMAVSHRISAIKKKAYKLK